MLDRIMGILAAPDLEWSVIAHKDASSWAVFARYGAILALIPALAHWIGASFVGGYVPVGKGLVGALVIYAGSLAAVYLVALIVNLAASGFDAQRSFPRALLLAVYSAIPVWLAGIALAVPGLSFLAVLGLYAAYLLWTGLPVLMRAPAGRTLSYYSMVTGAALIIVFALGVVVARV
jgi:hypothetical protein